MRIAIAGMSAALIATGGAVALAGPADAAFNCSISRSGASETTSVRNNTCFRVRARIDRYYGGVVHIVSDDPNSTFSYAYNGTGTNAGNFSNKSMMGNSEQWEGWKSL